MSLSELRNMKQSYCFYFYFFNVIKKYDGRERREKKKVFLEKKMNFNLRL